MSFLLWLGLFGALFAAAALPGPAWFLLIECARLRGFWRAAPLAFGIALGDFLLVCATLLGAGVLLARWPQALTLLQIGGVAFLIVYFWRLLRKRGARRRTLVAPSGKLFRYGLFLTILHPGSLTFYIALLPHFFSEDRPFGPDFCLALSTGGVVALLSAALYLALGSGLFAVRRARRRSRNLR